MTKSEIIEAIANANVPTGATLVQRDTPIPGARISRIGEGQNELELILARLFANQLRDESEDLPEEASPALFNALHRSIISFHEAGKYTMPMLALGAVAEHRKMIEKLKEIAGQLGIAYEEPDDPLLLK